MFFMFSIFSFLSPHADTTQQKKSQEIAQQTQFAHCAQAPIASHAAEPNIAKSYTLQEQEKGGAALSLPSMPPQQAPLPVIPQPVAGAMPPIVINNYTSCSPSVVSSNNNKSDIQMNNVMSAEVSANMSAYMEQAQQMVNEELPQRMASLQGLLWEYRYRVAGGCIAVAYVLLCYHLYKARQYLSHNTVWSSWYNDLNMEELLAQDITVLSKSLIIAIQMRYANQQNPTDFIAPLIAFNIQIQQEIEELRAYWRFYMACKDWRLVKIVPFNLDKLDTLKEHIERAVYIQTVFKTWTANYNFAQNVRAHGM